MSISPDTAIDIRWCNIYDNQPDNVEMTVVVQSEYSSPQTVKHDLTQKAHLVERSYDGPPRTLCGAFASGDVTDKSNDSVCPVCVDRAIDMGWL